MGTDGLGNKLVNRAKSLQGSLFLTVYLLVVLLISLPFITIIWDLLYSNVVPSGGDPADHVLFTINILETGSPLVEYTQFPSILSDQPNRTGPPIFYPSFLHVGIAVLSLPSIALGFSNLAAVLFTLQGFMLISYIIGIVGFAMLIKLIVDTIIPAGYRRQQPNIGLNSSTLIYLCFLLVAFSIFIYSTSPIIKTFRDGSYGEVLSMWTILPYYLYSLRSRRWVPAGILLGIIASTHNLSFFLTLLATMAVFIGFIVNKQFKSLRQKKLFLFTSLICCAPAFAFFYYPTLYLAMNQDTGMAGASSQWSRMAVSEQVHPLLYYLGLFSSIALILLNYRSTAWLVVWLMLYLVPFSFDLFFLERFAREISVILGLLVGVLPATVAYTFVIKKARSQQDSPHIENKSYPRSRLIIVLLLAVAMLPVYSISMADRFELFGDPDLLNYFSSTMLTSYSYLSNVTDSKDSSIVVFGINPWLKPYLHGKLTVLETETPEGEKSLSNMDRETNEKLRSIVVSPNSIQSQNILKELNVRYVYLSDALEGRWYTESQRNLSRTFANFESNYQKDIFRLQKQWRGENNELVQIYNVSTPNIS